MPPASVLMQVQLYPASPPGVLTPLSENAQCNPIGWLPSLTPRLRETWSSQDSPDNQTDPRRCHAIAVWNVPLVLRRLGFRSEFTRSYATWPRTSYLSHQLLCPHLCVGHDSTDTTVP